MTKKSALRKLVPDKFLILLVGVVALASLLPARGDMAGFAKSMTAYAIALLFFLHGAKLSRQAIIGGITAWRVHVLVVISTFVMFPVLGIAAKHLADIWLNPVIGSGLLLLCIMPSTIQSSIAFTSMAGGNVPAAVCSASASSALGVFLTPLLAALLMSESGGGISLDAMYKIAVQLLLPFIIGHLSRPLIGRLVDRYKPIINKVDRGVILLVVYTAFSAAVVDGIWQRYSVGDLAWTFGFASVILAIALIATSTFSRMAHLNTEDEITVVFCGSKKSLASGVPIAGALFPAVMVGPLILPLMIFHQIQLMVCALLAQRYAERLRAKAMAESV